MARIPASGNTAGYANTVWFNDLVTNPGDAAGTAAVIGQNVASFDNTAAGVPNDISVDFVHGFNTTSPADISVEFASTRIYSCRGITVDTVNTTTSRVTLWQVPAGVDVDGTLVIRQHHSTVR